MFGALGYWKDLSGSWIYQALAAFDSQKCIQQHMELRIYPILEIGFGQLYQIYSNKQAHFLFSKPIFNVARARAATVDLAKYICHRLGT